LALLGAFGAEQGSIGGDRDRFVGGADLEDDVDTNGHRDLHAQSLLHGLIESGGGDRDVVDAGGQEASV
jgi:hypothetical protein